MTEQGQVVVASSSGSQLAPHVYGAGKVIWVAGDQKIVADLDEGLRRVEEYSFPLEDERMRRVRDVGSRVAKLLIVNAGPHDHDPGAGGVGVLAGTLTWG